MTIVLILGSVVLVSLASLVGAFVISFRQERLTRTFAFLIPLAVGALLGDAFFHLIPESFEKTENPAMASFLLFLGVTSFFFLEKFLRWHYHGPKEAISAGNQDDNNTQHLGRLILVSDGLHNFIDGIIIAVSYFVSTEVGIATTLAVILHELPHEIGDFGVLVYAGYERKAALFYNFLSALTAVAGAILILMLGSLPDQLIQGITPFTAGIFIYLASADLIPEIQKTGRGKNLLPETAGMGLGALAMYLLLFLD